LVRFGYDESGKRFASETTLLAEQTESRLPANRGPTTGHLRYDYRPIVAGTYDEESRRIP
jgi:hypothetical protein